MAGPEPYIDENGDERLTVRITQSDMRRIASQLGDVDGIPLDVAHMSMHRMGTFSLKEDLEGGACQQLDDDGHGVCPITGGRSTDAGMRSSIIDFKYQTNGYLTEDAFEDYDTARQRPCP